MSGNDGNKRGKPPRLQGEYLNNMADPAPSTRLQRERKAQSGPRPYATNRTNMPPRLQQEQQQQAMPPRLQEEMMSQAMPPRLQEEMMSQAMPPRLQQELRQQAITLDKLSDMVTETNQEIELEDEDLSYELERFVDEDKDKAMIIDSDTATERLNWTEWTEEGMPFERMCLKEEDLPQLTFHRNVFGCLPVNWMPAIMESKNSKSNLSKFKRIIFQDDSTVTDAVLESWYWHLKSKFHPSLLQSINLQGCRFLTDWGIHWLAMLLKGRTGVTKIKLDGCSGVSEQGLLELCSSGPVLELSCNNTAIASLPDIVSKHNPQHRVIRKHFPLSDKPDTEKKVFGPYNKVLIHLSTVCSTSLLDLMSNARITSDTTAAMVTDMELKPVERLVKEYKEKPLMVNTLQMSQNDSCFGLMTSEEPHQVIIPFDDSQDVEDVAAVVTDIIKENVSKEKPGVSSALEEVKVTVPPCLWSVQAVQEFLVDFHTGIIELHPRKEMSTCSLMFGEQMNSYFNRLELEVLECTGEDVSMEFDLAVQLRVLEPYNETQLPVIYIKAGDQVVLEYLPSKEIVLKQNNTTIGTVKEFQCGFPVLSVGNPNFSMKLQVKNLNCLASGDPFQYFVKANFHNLDFMFDHSSGILRCDNSAKKTFAFRGVRGLFKGIQPLTKDNNVVAVKILDMGKQGDMSFGLSHLVQREKESLSNPWMSDYVYYHLGHEKIVVSSSSSTKQEMMSENMPELNPGDILKIEVTQLDKDYVEPSDEVIVKFYQNSVQFHELTWKSEFCGRIYPAISLNNTDECLQIVNFKDPKPLHQRMADTCKDPVLVCGQRKCKLTDNVIEAGPNCRDQSDYKDYFMAANSLCRYNPYFEITVKHVNEDSIFSLGLVHASHLKNKSPGNSQGTVGWLIDDKGSSIHVSQKKDTTGSRQHMTSVMATKNKVLGCAIRTENVVWDEYGLPVPFQDINICFNLKGRKMHETTFKYLGGGLFPYIQMGQAGVQIQINQLLDEGFSSVQMRPKDLPVDPGTQYIMAAISTGDRNKDWSTKVKSLENTVHENLKRHAKNMKKQKQKIWNSSKVCYTDHQAVSVLSRTEHNINILLSQWKKRTSFVTVNAAELPKGVAELSGVLSRNTECSVLHHLHLYHYTEEVHTVLDTICQLKPEKIVTLQQVQQTLQNGGEQGSQVSLVETCLRRLQQWGKVLLFPVEEPTTVITDPGWFVSILGLLPKEANTEALLECVGGDTPLWTPKELLTKKTKLYQNTIENFSREKVILLLQVLVDSGLLMRLKPSRNEKSDPRYYLAQPCALGILPSQSALKKYFDNSSCGNSDKFIRVRKLYKLRLEPLSPHVWYCVLAALTEFCEPKMLWNEGLVWHQGPVECVLVVEKTDNRLSSLIYEAKTYSVDVSSTSVAPRAKALLQDVFRTYTDVVDAVLLQHSVLAECSVENVNKSDEGAVCSIHQWERAVGQSGVSVCTLCNNCCDEGLRCDYNGILHDKPLVCLCETERSCCLHCGVCQRCATKLWTYRSKLQPGCLLTADTPGTPSKSGVSQIAVSKVSSYPIDTALCNEFYIRVPDTTTVAPCPPSWGLLSEDGDEFCVCVSSRIILDCPSVAYSYPVNSSNLSFFTTVPGYKKESHAVYKVKLSDPKIPPIEEDSTKPSKYSFSVMSGLWVYDETGIVECEENNWTETKVTGYIVSKLPLSSKCFYYEAEIMAIGSDQGFAGIGLLPLENENKYRRMKFGFLASVANTLVGDLEDQSKDVMGVLPAVKVGDKLGVGMIYKSEDEPHQVFFTLNGERQKLKVTTSRELNGHVLVQGPGWRVRLTSRGVWRHHPDDIQEASDAVLEREKSTQDWGKYETLDISPQSLLKFKVAAKIPGQEDEIHAQIVLKANPDKQHHVLYKIEVSNYNRYVCKPLRGVISPGQTEVISVIGKCGETTDVSLDKFRVEWKIDVVGLSQKNYGTEYTGFGRLRHGDGPFSIFDNKWTVAWTDDENNRSMKHAVLFSKIMTGTGALEGTLWVDQFVKNLYSKKKQSKIVPQPLPKVDDCSPSTPQYVLEVYRDGDLCSRSWLPKKKYYIAKIEESTELGSDAKEDKDVSLGLFVPRLQASAIQGEFVPGMTVYKALTPELFDRGMSILVNETKSILTIKPPPQQQKGGKGSVSLQKVSSAPKKVNFKENVEAIDLMEGIVPKDEDIAAEFNLTVMYGACTVMQSLGNKQLLLEWNLGELSPLSRDLGGEEEQDERAWKLFVCEGADLHSQFWVDHLNYFHQDRRLEKKSMHKSISAWDAEPTGSCSWETNVSSSEIKMNKHLCLRSKDSHFDAIRGAQGFTEGVHVFHIDVKTEGNEGLKGFQFGLCTEEAEMKSEEEAYLGEDVNSWVYDMSSGDTNHRGISTPVTNTGMNMLQQAASENNITRVTELLSIGADIDAPTPTGLTPLHLACYGHNIEMLELLLDQGADINKATKTGLTALHLACYEHQKDLLEFLLNRGADINRTTKRKNTGLHIASIGGYEDLVESLVEHGADLNLQTANKGYTALHIAAQENYVKIVQILVQNGADRDVKTHDGHTALTEALQKNHHSIVTFLAGSEDISHIMVPSTTTTAKEDIKDENVKPQKPRSVRSVTLEMKLNLLNPKWPYVTLRFPKFDDFMCTAFEGPVLTDALSFGMSLYPCVGISPSEAKVRCSIKLVYTGTTDVEEIPEETNAWEKIGIYHPDVNVPYGNIPGPNVFPAEKEKFNIFSSDISLPAKKTYNSYIKSDLSKTVVASCRNRILVTAHLREFEDLDNVSLMEQLEHLDFLPQSVFVPLPQQLDLDTLRFPSLHSALDVDKLCLHFLCKPSDARFEELHEQSYMIHFVDRAGVTPQETLPDDLCFGLCSTAWAYLSTKKTLLPKYEHLVDLSVTKGRSRSQVEHLIENYLRLLSSVAMANYKHRDYSLVEGNGLVIRDRQEGFEKDFKSMMNYVSGEAKQKLSRTEAAESLMCNSHQYGLVISEGLSLQHAPDIPSILEGVQEGMLNLQPFAPYNELITAIRLITNMDQLQELPAHFQEIFPNLKILLLDEGNSLKKLPVSIGKLQKLRVLSVTSFITEGDTLTQELPQDIGDCKELEEIHLSQACMTGLPESVTNNRRLKVLEVASNNIKQLPPTFGDLKRLEVINLNSNPISSLPENTGNMKNLTTLHLSGIALMPTRGHYLEKEAYEQWFENQEKETVKVLTLNRIQELYSSCKTWKGGVQITDLHQINAHLFYEVPRLGLDYIDGDEDGGIPEPIFQLENLETLDLSNQAIRFVPPQINQLTKLKKLILSKNMLLETLPGALGSMKKLRTIRLRNCPSIKTPPAEIIGRGVQAIRAFLRRLSGGTTDNWRTKLMLVGLGGAGKTSLLRALMSPTHKTIGTTAAEITDGIDIKPWTAQDHHGRKITFSTWDFAGQDVYYNTHQFFLSGRAVYLLLWTCRLGFEHAGLDFWLSSIQCHAPKAPIFVVGTHYDQVSKAQIPKEMLMKKYPQIKGFHFVSSVKGTGVHNLEKHLLEVTKLESYMGESVPTVYLSLENRILQLRKEKNVIPWATVQQLAVECGIFNVDDIKRAVIFLHDLGTVQYFDNEFLRDHVVINPQWIVDVMTCVVSVKNSPIEDGKFYHSSIRKVWKDYPEDLHEWLLRLTEEFDLTFPIPSQPINLVPCLLPETEPKFEWPEVRKGERESMMLYRFTYLPAGLFNRTQVRLFQFSDGKDIWKRGSLLRKNGHLALIKQLNDKEMLVRVQGPRPENVMFLIHEVIESLVMESFSGVSYDFLIPCPDCIRKTGSNLPEKALFECSLIKEAVEWNTPFLQCRLHFHAVSMSVLQAAMPSQKDNEIDVHLSQSMRALEDLRSSCTTDVFVHYCEEDLPTDESKAVHPVTVVKDLQKAGFSCWYRDNLSKVDIQEVTLGLQNSKMLVVFMSTNYERQRQCCDLFKYAKHTLNKPFQVVALGEDMNWTKTNMGGMEIGSHHVFVNMRQKDRYPAKIAELQKHVQNKLDSLKQTSSYPRCFISYAWTNSHQAIKLGSKQIPGALGWEKGDPRYIKDQLEANGVSCWLDTEQTGKAGLFEDISKGIRHADVMIVFVSTEYTKSKNCMMELRFAECSLEKPLIAVSVGTSDDWRFSEVLMLLNRTKTPVIHMQTPNEDGLKKLITLVKECVSNSTRKSEDPKVSSSSTTATNEPVRYTEVSFQEEYELAQRRLVRHVSMLAAMMDTTPYPRLFALDLKEKQTKYERPSSARSIAHDATEQRHHLHKRESKVMARVEDYDPSWTESSLVVKLFCEYDGGLHTVADDLDITADMHPSEREDLVKVWADYLGRVYALLKHSTVSVDLLNMEQGKHLQKFIKQCMSESDGNFSEAYIKMRDKIIATDTGRIMGKLDRCHLPTGQIRWLCPEHQKGYRITVLSSDVDVGTVFGEGHLPTQDDQLIKEKIEELSHLVEPYIKGRKSQQPRKMPAPLKDTDVQALPSQKPSLTSTDANPSHQPSSPGQSEASDTSSTSGKVKPKPKPRLSRLGTPDRPVSANTKAKMKAGAKAIQSGEGSEGKNNSSQACQIL